MAARGRNSQQVSQVPVSPASTRDTVGANDQCKEMEGNNRMGKTRDLFKKIRDTKGIFHAEMGSIKDRNGVDLTEGEDIKRRYTEHTESEVAQSCPTLSGPMDCSLAGSSVYGIF